jgi:K+-sensing histidine kinase KdpD
MKPSFLSSTLSLMAFISFMFVLLRATYSLITGEKIDLPDWAISIISATISSYVTARLPNNKTEEEHSQPTEDFYSDKLTANDTSNQQ